MLIGKKEHTWFSQFARSAAMAAGRPSAFAVAVAVLVVWAVSGPIFGFSDTWQLVINTGTTIVTFLMVFIIQNSQNRDTKIVQLKLDALIHAMSGVEDKLIELENMSDEDLEALHSSFQQLANGAKTEIDERAGRKKPTRRRNTSKDKAA